MTTALGLRTQEGHRYFASKEQPLLHADHRELRRHPALLAEQVVTYAAADRELTSAIGEALTLTAKSFS